MQSRISTEATVCHNSSNSTPINYSSSPADFGTFFLIIFFVGLYFFVLKTGSWEYLACRDLASRHQLRFLGSRKSCSEPGGGGDRGAGTIRKIYAKSSAVTL